MACCLDCHFKLEERHLKGVLPDALYQHLLREHDEIRDQIAAGCIPSRLLLHHAAWEDRVFPEYVSPRLLARLERDHKRIEGYLRFFGAGNNSEGSSA